MSSPEWGYRADRIEKLTERASLLRRLELSVMRLVGKRGDRRFDPPVSDSGRTFGVESVKPGNVVVFPQGKAS